MTELTSCVGSAPGSLTEHDATRHSLCKFRVLNAPVLALGGARVERPHAAFFGCVSALSGFDIERSRQLIFISAIGLPHSTEYVAGRSSNSIDS
jgi:hypothetical protein